MNPARSAALEGLTLTFVGKVRRGSVFALRSDHKELQLYVSDGGKSLRVFDPNRKMGNGKLGGELL